MRGFEQGKAEKISKQQKGKTAIKEKGSFPNPRKRLEVKGGRSKQSKGTALPEPT